LFDRQLIFGRQPEDLLIFLKWIVKAGPFIDLRFKTRAFLVHCPETTPRYGFLLALLFSTY